MTLPRIVFADASYWIGLLAQGDQNNAAARKIDKELQRAKTQIVTSELMLSEVLAFFASNRRSILRLREVAGEAVNRLYTIQITIIPFDQMPFAESLRDYRRFRDKMWSLADCSSFIAMRKNGIDTALTFDGDFEQAGFTTLPQRQR